MQETKGFQHHDGRIITPAPVSYPDSMPALQRTSEILSQLLSPKEISSVVEHLKLYDEAPFISYHGLKNCSVDFDAWRRWPHLNMGLIYNIYNGQGLLCANLRKERGAYEPTSGRITCSVADGVDYRSLAAWLIRKSSNSGGFPPSTLDSNWGFPDYPTIMFSRVEDRELYRNVESDKIPHVQQERSTSEIPCSEFIALSLCNEEQVRYFFEYARDSDAFSYTTLIHCGVNHIALPDFHSKLSDDKCYHLMPRCDFEEWFAWSTKSTQ